MRTMTPQEQALVMDNLSVVEQVLRSSVTVRADIPGMEYDDLYQTGCLALCLAAQRYDGRAPFPAFARVAVRNALMDYFTAIRRHTVPAVSLDKLLGEGDTCTLHNLLADPATAAANAEHHAQLRSLASARRRHTGVAGLGMEAMLLQAYGFESRDIGPLYGVASKTVAAWVARARKVLKNDRRFQKEFPH